MSMETTNKHNQHNDGVSYHSEEFPVVGKFYSADISINATAFDVKKIIENMPNIATVSVQKVVETDFITWMVTFTESANVPLFSVNSSNVVCNGGNQIPIVTIDQLAAYTGEYSWMAVSTESGGDVSELQQYHIRNLTPGVMYSVQISAMNQMGFGARMATAPSSLSVPITPPTSPTQKEGPWAGPRLIPSTPTSLLVTIGPPVFDGGSFGGVFLIEWDTSSFFNSAPAGDALGSAIVPSYQVLCSECVSAISFMYNTVDPVVTVTYNGTENTARQLTTGSRIVITTADDMVSYTFTVGDSRANSSAFTLMDHGIRQTRFNSSTLLGDLYLLGADYEIEGLNSGLQYYVRVKAENALGVCDPYMSVITDCGAFTLTSPPSAIPKGVSDAPTDVSAVVVGANSVMVTWATPHSIGDIASYRVDVFRSSRKASSASYSFFGDAEIQTISTPHNTSTTGTFTVAYSAYVLQLPGTVSGVSGEHVLYTSEDLSPYLLPGDTFLVDRTEYTVASYNYPSPSQIAVIELVQASTLDADVADAIIMVYPKTYPVAANCTAVTLQAAMTAQTGFGQVHVERSLSDIGYAWSVTFLSNTGDQPTLTVNTKNLLGRNPTVSIVTARNGTLPYKYQSMIVRTTELVSTSALFSTLSSGDIWYFRVLATNDIGDSMLSSAVSAVPASSPLSPSSLVIEASTGSSLLVTYTQDAYYNGDKVTAYILNAVSASESATLSLPVTNRVQHIVSSAYQLPFTDNSTFSLSVGNFYGKYYNYAGLGSTYPAQIDVSHGSTYVQSSATTTGQVLSNLVTPGEFIMIGGQEFRVCADRDPTFQNLHGNLNSSVIPLCTVDNAYVRAVFDVGYTGHVLKNIPMYLLDTVVGGAPSPIMGSSILNVQLEDGSLNVNVGYLVRGDRIMVGHPFEGEVFRVYSNYNSMLTLASSDDVTAIASLSIASLRHATYEIQLITFNTSYSSQHTTVSQNTGFRLRFRGATTFLTKEGGSTGCLSIKSSAATIRAELVSLISIDDVLVQISTPSNSSNQVNLQLTFVGDLVRGSQPSIEVIDLGSNGCNNFKNSTVLTTISKIRTSVVPVYTLETTPDLPYDASASDVKDALEGLNLVARADVTRIVQDNGYKWMVTFRGYTAETSDLMPALLVNSVSLQAAIEGSVTVTSVNEYVLSGLNSSDPYYVSVSAVNAYGIGASINSSPRSKQTSNQVPQSVQQLRSYIKENSLNVQFNSPISNGGYPVSHYKVQFDPLPTFNSGLYGGPIQEIILYSNSTARQSDVQLISVVSDFGFIPGGTFVVQFLGQWTPELDSNISAIGMAYALEELSTVNSVTVTRDLFCSTEAGRNNCGDQRGYVWTVILVDVVDNGLQVEEYIDSFETNIGTRLTVTGDFLQGCEKSNPTVCFTNSTTVAFTDTRPEVQQICLCTYETAIGYLLGTKLSLNGTLTTVQLRNLLVPIVGSVTISGPVNSRTTLIECGCPASGAANLYGITFDGFQGDVPLLHLSVGLATEIVKGQSHSVMGRSDYSADLTFSKELFSVENSTYIRVAAVNFIGDSDYVMPTVSPVRKYFTHPDQPENVLTVVSSLFSVTVLWQQVYNASSYVYTIQYDTTPTFTSHCTAAVCSSNTATSIGQIDATNVSTIQLAGVTYFNMEILELISGQPYYVRVRACTNATLCSHYSYSGYPSDPVPVIPGSTPSPVSSAVLTPLDASSISVDWYDPEVLPYGMNGQPVSAYTVSAATPVSEVQTVTFTDTAALFTANIMLRYESQLTRCMPLSADALELEVKLQEIIGLGSVSVDLIQSTSVSRIFTVTFPDTSSGISALSYGGFCVGSNSSVSFSTVDVAVSTVIQGQRSFIPEIYGITTNSNRKSAGGGFEILYGYIGNMQKLLPTADLTNTISANISAGARILITSSSVNHILSPGAIIRIGSQEVAVKTVSLSGLSVTFSPYHVLGSGSGNLNVFISETLLGSAQILSTQTFLTEIDMSSEIFPGSSVLITRGTPGSSKITSRAFAVILTVSSTVITLTNSVSLPGTSTHVLMYRQKSKYVPYDSAADEMKLAVEALSVGTVDVSRLGPNTADGYSWSVSFTSVYGSTDSCSGPCMQVSSTSTSALTVSQCAIRDTNGDYISDAYSSGRRTYVMPNSPYYIVYNSVTSSWEIRAQGILTPIVIGSDSTGSVYPSFGLAATVELYTTSPTPVLFDGTVQGSVVQIGQSPSLLNIAAQQVVSSRTSEIQSVTLSTTDGLFRGGFTLDFNYSMVPVYIRADESSADFGTKLESLPTVGGVSVQRTDMIDINKKLLGYQWNVTFDTNNGDLPLLTYSVTPAYGLPLAGADATITISKAVRGSAIPSVATLSGLTAGNQYSVQVVSSNAFGVGESTVRTQNVGRGVKPLSINLYGQPSPPTISSATARSSSQLEVVLGPSDSTGGSESSTYFLEYTTNSTFGQTEQITFMMYNTGSNTTYGYFRLIFDGYVTSLLPWGVSGDDMAEAIYSLSIGEYVSVSQTVLSPGSEYSAGYRYTISITQETSAVGNFSVDVSRLSSSSASNNFHVTQESRTFTSEPYNFQVQRMYTDCQSLRIGSPSSHQVVTIERALGSGYGNGSFRLTMGAVGYSGSSSTPCLPYTLSADDLKGALKNLLGLNNVFVESSNRPYGTALIAYTDFHVYLPEGQNWPTLRVNGSSNGQYWTGLAGESCRANVVGSPRTIVSVVTVEDRVSCIGGTSEVQTIVLEGRPSQPLGGYFYLYLYGEKSLPLAVTATAKDVAAAVNMFSDVSGVTVDRYAHSDPPFSGYAWTVTFPVKYGNVEQFGVDDKHVTGSDTAVTIYPMLNITMTADVSDIDGHFQISIGSETSIPISYNATDNAVLNALQNMTNIGKVCMFGRKGFQTLQSVSYTGSVLSYESTNTFTLHTDASTMISVGDRVTFSNGANYTSLASNGYSYISGMSNSTASGFTTVTLRDNFTPYLANIVAQIGTYTVSKKRLPGRVSVVALASIISITKSSKTVILSNILALGSCYVNGTLISLSSVTLCSDGSGYFCGRLVSNYSGISVVESSPIAYVFPTAVSVLFSVFPTALVSVGDMIWIGDDELTVINMTNLTVTVSGKDLHTPYEGATAFYSGNGYERAMIFKATSADLGSARVTVLPDWRGTNVQIHTVRSKGIPQGSVLLGGLSEVQTVTFRAPSANLSLSAGISRNTYQLMLGLDAVGNFTYGASAAEWRAKLQSVLDVDHLEVTRVGDGISPIYSYGYSYTVTFWGTYGLTGIPELSSNMQNLTQFGLDVRHDTVREGEYVSDFNSRLSSLDENSAYSLRVRAVNAKGISLPSATTVVSTELSGGLPSQPRSLILGQYKTASTLSVSFQPPQYDGGLPITSYLIEADSTLDFDPASDTYQSTLLSNIPEVQRITTSFRAGDNVRTRGGTFTLFFGGRSTAPLPAAITAYDLEVALNLMFGTRQVAVPPVTVTRQLWNRGYRWIVTFDGIDGDIGLLQADSSMLTGDEPSIEIVEVTKGAADITPGGYTHEVQSIRVTSLAPITQGTFILSLGGYSTPPISYDESATVFLKKIESIPVIHTVKVNRELVSAVNVQYVWTVTFTHMRREVVQGAGSILPFTLVSNTFDPLILADILIFEEVKGTHPFSFTLTNLSTAVVYNTRVTAYNARGYSTVSAVSSALVLAQPPILGMVLLTINSGSSLNVTWSANTGILPLKGLGPSLSLPLSGVRKARNGTFGLTLPDYNVDGYLIEYYTTAPIHEVQVITTSSSAGLSEVQRITVDSDENNLAGYFRLEYMGQITGKIKFNANAEGALSVSEHLVRLSTMGAVDVIRSLSKRAVPGVLFNGTQGLSYVTSASTVSLSTFLSAGDYVWIGKSSLKFRVLSVDIIPGQVVLDQAMPFVAFVNAVLYKWSYGYTWDVTFTTQLGDLPQLIASTADNWGGTNPVLKIDTLRHGIAPISGTFRVGFKGTFSPPLDCSISADGMEAALEDLDTVGRVNVERFRNGFGYDWRVTFVSEVGNPPSLYVNDAGLSGPYAKAAVSNMLGGVAPSKYGSLFISGGSATSAVISGLSLGTPYQVRVSAHNSEGYSYPLVSYPTYLAPKTPPSPPFGATFYALSPSRLVLAWNTPTNTGGSPIVMYRVEYDITSDFRNVPQNGHVREITVPRITNSSTYCSNIDIVPASKSIPRYARLFAYNGYAWSRMGYPTPLFTIGEIKAPGPPIHVHAVSTSARGILATWNEPAAFNCMYGGDGGTPVTYYVIEWDTLSDFSSPAAQAVSYDLSQLSFNIGGRDAMTGVMSDILESNTVYYIRVTAFNGKGASPAGYAEHSVTTTDVLPDAPGNVTVLHGTGSATELSVSWTTPQRDGGATIEKYRLLYSTDPAFTSSSLSSLSSSPLSSSLLSGGYSVVDYPVIPEVQTIIAESPVKIEVQAIRVLTAVTNERQIIRTRVNGTDEVQTVTTTCDDVTNEVQRFTTTAVDINEVQTLEITGTQVIEVQLLRSSAPDVPSIQVVQISSPLIPEVQIIGAILTGISIPSSCVLGSDCPAIDQGFSGSYTLSFDPNACGNDPTVVADDSNWCLAALIQSNPSRTGYDCSGSACISALIYASDAVSDIQNKICSITSSTGLLFMQDSSGTCGVQVTAYSSVLLAGSSGVYMFAYTVTFGGTTVRGNVPQLQVRSGYVTYPGGTSVTNYGVTTVGNIYGSSGGSGYELVRGNQPSGVVALTYTCESLTVPMSVIVSNGGSTILVTDTVPAVLAVYQYVRLQTSYHQIVALTFGTNYATISPPFRLSSATIAGGSGLSMAEYGVFYSDPTASNGVSQNCLGSNQYSTVAITPIDTDLSMLIKIRALTGVINQDSDSVSVTRHYYPSSSRIVGYNWTITFHKQHGQVPLLLCDTSNLKGSSSSTGANCTVTATQLGSLIQGNFSLGTTFPNALQGVPLNYTTSTYPWNMPASLLASSLSSIVAVNSNLAFGKVAISRRVYIPSGHTRWAGGYLWTVKYTGRNGKIPALTHTNDLYFETAALSINGTVALRTGTQRSLFDSDDPFTAVTGNQAQGFFSLSFTDKVGFSYTSANNYFPVVQSDGEAMSALNFEFLLNSFLGNQSTTATNVTRSASPNSIVGYKYYITFIGRNVGGNVGSLIASTSSITSTSLSFVNGVTILENVVGAELRGSFQLRFNGYSTGALAHDSDAATVELALNNLASIAPSKVSVSRAGPMITPHTQVSGYVWSVTFTSNTWIDPTLDHSTYVTGNWFGSPSTYADKWPSGYSKAWGKNVGNVPSLFCIDSALYVTNGALPYNGCTVEEVIPGTAPLSGSFQLSLNTTGHEVINIQGVEVTASIKHNAQGNSTETGGDGSSVQEKLMALNNVGSVTVVRSDVNTKDGGYTWTITFLRDGTSAGGQWGGDCEQRDSIDNLCNSPGNVPSLTYVDTGLHGTCKSFAANSTSDYNCTLMTILTGDSSSSASPPGSKAVQEIYLDDPLYNSAFALTDFFNMSYTDNATDSTYHTACVRVNSTAATVQAAIETMLPLNPSYGSRGVSVSTRTDTVSARNGQVLTVRFFDEGPKNLLNVQKCENHSYEWTVRSRIVTHGNAYALTALSAGVKNGVVQRGKYTSLYVPGCKAITNTTKLRWNAPGEGTDRATNLSVKSYLEGTCPLYIVNVTRLVIGKYGVVQYEVRFVYTKGVYPPGAGVVPLLTVKQGNATDDKLYAPIVYEEVRGSTGLSGYYGIDLGDPNGPRTLRFQEPAWTLKRKLEEMTTVGSVYVERTMYPNSTSGGWGELQVTDGSIGGYEWKVYFLSNPGTSNGYSFPPGAGNVDPIIVTYDAGSTIFGTDVAVESFTYSEGSTPINGAFTLAYNGVTSDPIKYDQMPLELKYHLQNIGTIGDVSVTSNYRTMQRLEGVYVTAEKDSNVLSVQYDNSSTYTTLDIRQMLDAGDVFRVGGSDDGDVSGRTQLGTDGAELYISASMSPLSPILTAAHSFSSDPIYPGESLRIGVDDYSVMRTGVEVQVLSVDCAAGGSAGVCGGFYLAFTHNGIAEPISYNRYCIRRPEGGEMSSASYVQNVFDSMSSVNHGDVMVTRTTNVLQSAYVFTLYFEGPSVVGDVYQVVPVQCGNGLDTSLTEYGGSVTVLTSVQGGYTEVQTVRVNTEAGYISGSFFRLAYTSTYRNSYTNDDATTDQNSTIGCLSYGAEASAVQAALQAVDAVSSRLMPFTVTGKTIEYFGHC